MRTSSTLLTSSSLAEWKGSSCSADGGSATARKPEGMTSAQRRLTAANQLDRVDGCDEALAPRPPPPRDRVELRQLAK